jgi:glutathione S-transferase
MIHFYFHPTPNPAKIALFLEEAGLPYEAIPVDTSKGEQYAPSFLAINPNGKVPAIIDTEGPGGRQARVFDSTAILIYLAANRLGPRPVLWPGRAFPTRRARRSRLRGEPVPPRSGTPLPGPE